MLISSANLEQGKALKVGLDDGQLEREGGDRPRGKDWR